MVRRLLRPGKLFAGSRVRRRREERRITQAQLARLLELSPSYVNQIEMDQRPLPRRLLEPLSGILDVNVTYFEDGEETRTVHDLREASADPVFGARPITLDEAFAAVRHAPEVTSRFLSLYRTFHAEREVRTGRFSPDDTHEVHVGSGLAYDEVRDWVQSHRNYFDAIDRAAERQSDALGLDCPERFERLAGYLNEAHGLVVESDATMQQSGLVWCLRRKARRLLLAADASNESRIFWMAHIIGLLDHRRLFERQARQASFASDNARGLARVSLANYYAGALLMPYGRFLEQARAMRYDIERLQSRFGASFEQVCHRLSSMQRPSLPGLPFFFLKTDIAGNVLKRSSATRFQFARFGGQCPLWNVYSAFARPGQILVQLARTPDDVIYLNIARTVGRGGGRYLSRPRSVAVVLGCEIEYAPLTVYAAGLDLSSTQSAVPIGPGCRACDRVDCRHRAMPSVGQKLDVGSEERGMVPYRISRELFEGAT